MIKSKPKNDIKWVFPSQQFNNKKSSIAKAYKAEKI